MTSSARYPGSGSRHDIQSAAEASGLSLSSYDPWLTKSPNNKIPGYPDAPHFESDESLPPSTLRTLSRSVTVRSDSDMPQTGMPAADMHLPTSAPSSTVISLRSLERLRLAELERNELLQTVAEERAKVLRMQRLAEEERAIAKKERAIAQRLKRERNVLELSATETNFRASQLKIDVPAAGAALPRRSTAELFKTVCSTDLLFLMDTTSSMRDYIQSAKEQVMNIVNDVKLALLNEVEVRIAVVGYKDHSDRPNIEFLDFTISVDRVYSFLRELTATGGADVPEDVLGGIRQALNATWKQQTRCIIHIADAPPHGRTLHDFFDYCDSYSIPGSEPHGLIHDPLLEDMIRFDINYALLRINNSTDRMAFTFFQAYNAAFAECKLHEVNKYYRQACTMLKDFHSGFRSGGYSKRSVKAGLHFEEAMLGTKFSALRHLVSTIVAASASCTAARVLTLTTRAREAGTKMASIVEEDEDEFNVRLENILPQWDILSWFDETLTMEGFSIDVMAPGASTLNDMMTHDENIRISVTEVIIHKRSRPFAQGAMRLAFYARTAASTNRFVVKSLKRDVKWHGHMFEDMRCQALCKAFALEFNALLKSHYPIDFIVTTCLKDNAKIILNNECIFLEPFIEGTFIKYNNNCGYVRNDNDEFNLAAQAFSHFTFERSQGYFLVSDLQGVGYILTDPAIHTLDPERFQLAESNLGVDGFKFFFSTHVCNHICRKLELKSKASMIMTSRYVFRENWLKLDNTVYCSNKLCGRIMRSAQAKESPRFPGYHWCDVCWPQLYSSRVKWTCLAPRPNHEFEVSRFFHESQGRRIPGKCAKHRNEQSYPEIQHR